MSKSNAIDNDSIPNVVGEDVEIIELIGIGSSGKVSNEKDQGVYKNQIFAAHFKDEDVAVKAFTHDAAFHRELKNLKRLKKHPNVLQLVAVIPKSRFDGKGALMLELAQSSVAEMIYKKKLYETIPLRKWAIEIGMLKSSDLEC